jgi:predicted RNA-binding protein YlxR (DUF448 family)
MEMTVAERNEPKAGAESATEDSVGSPVAGARSDARQGRRTCVGCGQRADAHEADLVRLVLGPGGEIAVDPGDGGFGRGAHVHVRPACLQRAATAGLARAAKAKPMWRGDDGELAPLSEAQLRAGIADVFARRVDALLGTAKRARTLHVGADAVVALLQRTPALVVVACDAASGADTDEVRQAVAEGRALAWGTKITLGAACRGGGPEGVAVVGIESPQLGAAVKAAVAVVTAASGGASTGAGACRPCDPAGSTVGGASNPGKSTERRNRPRAEDKAREAKDGALCEKSDETSVSSRAGGRTPPRQSRTERGS